MADVRFLSAGGFRSSPIVNGAPAFTNYALDASGKKIGIIWQAPEAATITHLGVRYGVRTGTPPVHKISLQSLGTTGLPSGTILGGGSPASATFTPPADATWNGTWQWVALSNSYAAARGELFAVVIEYSSGTVDGSNNSSFTYIWDGSFGTNNRSGFPYTALNSGAGFAKELSGTPVTGWKSASQVYGAPIQSFAATTTGGANHRIARRIILPAGSGATKQIVGLRFPADNPSAGTTWKIGLWKTDNTELQALSIDSDAAGRNSLGMHCEFMFDEATLSDLDFGTAYYLGIQRDGSSNFTIHGLSFAAANDMKAMSGGDGLYLATYDGSSWTETTTTMPYIEPIFADWTEPAGGGGGLGNRIISASGGLIMAGHA